MKITPVLCALTAAAIISPAFAQTPVPANKDASKITPGAYSIEPNHTRVVFGVSHKGFTTFFGEFRKLTGGATLDPKNLAATKVDLTVPVATITTQIPVLDEELRSKPWFDAATWPNITFKSTSVKQTGPGAADVTGDFSFHGVTKPLVLHVKFNGSGMDLNEKAEIAGFTVTGSFKRSDYNFKTDVPLISDDVELNIQAAFKKQ